MLARIKRQIREQRGLATGTASGLGAALPISSLPS
jgi:hypothetical protein